MMKILFNNTIHTVAKWGISVFYSLCILVSAPFFAEAATLELSPGTGVYTAQETFTVRVVVNTEGKPINAADATLSFNPKELSVVSLSRSGSIFGLWTQEPSFSNAQGSITFGGGSPSGYTGRSGSVLSVTFRALSSGTPKVTFGSGSILAADGMGTNVLTAMGGGTYTINAQSSAPQPEYVAPANTPPAPVVTSSTHPLPDAWYQETTAHLAWKIPEGVVAVRTLLDTKPNTIPTVVFDEPITSRTLDDLPQGTSYFHIQFKNADGWGKPTHVRLNVDSEPPKDFTVREESADPSNPVKTLLFSFEDVSPVTTYELILDGEEPIEFADEKESKTYVLRDLKPGKHTIVVRAIDSAGNTSVADYTFEITPLSAPEFTEYPIRVAPDVIPALKGTAVPSSTVHITVVTPEGGEQSFTTEANSEGFFVFVPDNRLGVGVHEITAYAIAQNGAQSDVSSPIRIIVETPGYLRVGSLVVDMLSVIVPLLALTFVLVLGVWYGWHSIRRMRSRVAREAHEAERTLGTEVDRVVGVIRANITLIQDSRKTKMTKSESEAFTQIEEALTDLRTHVGKEISDIEHIVE